MELTEINEEGINKLGKWLSGKFDTYKVARREAEDQWLKNLRQYLGVYDEELKRNMEPTQSQAYPKLTRVKVVSMVSRLMSLLFPNTEKNWSLSPSKSPTVDSATLQAILDVWMQENPDNLTDLTDALVDKLVARAVKDSADLLESVIEDQLSDTSAEDFKDYTALVRKVMFSAVLYSVGVLKGPMTIKEAKSTYAFNAEAAKWEAKSTSGFRPYFEFVSIWDYYPDMSAKNFEQMDGQFQRHVFSAAQLKKLAKRDDFMGDRISKFLRGTGSNYEKQQFETELEKLGDSQNRGEDKYEAIEYWGYVRGIDLRNAGVNVEDADLSKMMLANVWSLDDVVIKAKKNPFDKRNKLYHQFIFEEDEVHLTGSGLPPIMRDSQMSVSSGARMLMDNAAAVAGPSAEVDVSLLEPGSDTSIRPFAVYRRDVENVSDNRRAVHEIKFDSHIGDILSIVKTFKEFADQETFVNPLTGGDASNVPGEALRTQGGASMLFGSAALPFQDIVRNFDLFTSSVVQSLVAWNRMFNNTKRQIIGDIRPVARGAKGLLAKEVRAYALDNMVTTLTEEEKLWIDDEQLVKERFSVRDLPVDRILVSKEEHDRRVKQRDERNAQQQAMQDALMAAQTKKATNEALKDASQARKNLDNADVALFNALREAIAGGLNPDDIFSYIATAQATLTQDESGAVSGEGARGGPAADSVPGGQGAPTLAAVEAG